MSDANICVYTGRLGSPAKEFTTKAGRVGYSFSLGVGMAKKAGDGSWRTTTNWIQCLSWSEGVSRLTDPKFIGCKLLVIGNTTVTKSSRDPGQDFVALNCLHTELLSMSPLARAGSKLPPDVGYSFEPVEEEDIPF